MGGERLRQARRDGSQRRQVCGKAFIGCRRRAALWCVHGRTVAGGEGSDNGSAGRARCVSCAVPRERSGAKRPCLRRVLSCTMGSVCL